MIEVIDVVSRQDELPPAFAARQPGRCSPPEGLDPVVVQTLAGVLRREAAAAVLFPSHERAPLWPGCAESDAVRFER